MMFDSPLSERYPIYTRANVGEVFPNPVPPLMLDCGIPEAEAGWRDAWYRIGALEPDELSVNSLEQLGIVGGYCYLNVSLSRLFGERAPGLNWRDMDDQFFGTQPPDIPPYELQPGDVRPDLTARIGQAFQAAMEGAEVTDVLDDQEFAMRLRAERPELSALDDAALVARFLDLVTNPTNFRRLFGQHLYATYMAAVPVGIVRAVCAAAGRPEAALEVLSTLGDVESARPAMALWAMTRQPAGSAELRDAIRSFVAEFGWRGPNEWDLRSPSWESHPALVSSMTEAMRALTDEADPRVRISAARARGETTAAEIIGALGGVGDAERFIAARRAAATWIATRERTKANAIRVIHEARMALRELGTRMVARGHLDEVEDVGFMRRDELDTFIGAPQQLLAAIVERRQRHHELLALTPPFAFAGQPPDMTAWSRRDGALATRPASGSILQGVPGSPGIVEGPCRPRRSCGACCHLRRSARCSTGRRVLESSPRRGERCRDRHRGAAQPRDDHLP
jgi:rifampicin phosphotransferase